MIVPSPLNGKEPRIHEKAFIAPGSTIIGDVEIGEGTNVWPGATIRAAACKIKIGRNCSIQENVVVHSEAGTSITLGDHVLVGHGAIVHGPGDVGDNTLIGIGAIKLQGSSVGAKSLVGAGALVTKDLPEYAKAVGVPAKVIGKMDDTNTSPRATGVETYMELGKAFREKGLDQRDNKE